MRGHGEDEAKRLHPLWTEQHVWPRRRKGSAVGWHHSICLPAPPSHPSPFSCWCLGACYRPLHCDIDVSKTCGIGPGMSFANYLLSKFPGSFEIGLVPCAEGGTAIVEWARGSRLYSRMLNRAKESVSAGGEIKAVIWFQGESDTLSEEATEAYRGSMERLIGDLRSDLNVPSLPFIQVAIASGDERRVEKVREAQMGMDLDHVACVDAKGLPLNADGLHLSTEAQVELGRLLANTYVVRFLLPEQQ
ncbi:hypothetical protein HPP92_017267 [Vanilla planifolia]|uniref:Sialate O-acetylesterase domain-containing protein n=1 Tax=Vanilla planifolia TaxID=51239 RepID=A0A835QKI7_VANPL|nr:hypothetical protein HPP92_017267 [Vanilla planifolia]